MNERLETKRKSGNSLQKHDAIDNCHVEEKVNVWK